MHVQKITLPLLALSLAGAILSSGCTQRESGTVVGTIAGAAIGNQFGSGAGKVAMTALGAVAGSVIGGNVGQKMDDADHLETQRALERTRTNEARTWRNPDNGNRYTVTPTRTYETRGRQCRDYRTRAYIGDREEIIYGTACRQPDGSWVNAG